MTRVTELPVLASEGDFARMTYAEQESWAFRTWNLLQGRLSSSAKRGIVCGITSMEHGEGRSTWVNLLARAASERGFRVFDHRHVAIVRGALTQPQIAIVGGRADRAL